MKKITFLLLLPFLGFSQTKVSNVVSVSNTNATITLNNNTQIASLTLIGPSDRWLAAQFGSFSGGMEAGSDVVYFDGTNLVDATHGGIGVTPIADVLNNWTVTSNIVNSGIRTIVATRPFNSPDATDYDFVFSNATIGIAIAQGNTPSFTLAYHGADNRISNTAVPFTTLGVEDFSLNATQIYPNPSNGDFSVQSKTALSLVNIYTQTGAFVKTIVSDDENNAVVNVNGLATGVYLLELVNPTEKVWKKVIVK
jgi:hypothetical protein